MKIFADESSQKQKDLAYLLYYEQEKRFYIELPENADAWETPLLLDSFVKRGETTVNSYWSKIWVEQRIVPPDRQNIGEILRDNHLKEYDEYELLMLAMGRCAQDDYYLVPIDEKELPEEITKRFSKRIEDVLPLEDHCLLVFFRDGAVKKCDLQKHFEKTKAFQILLLLRRFISNGKNLHMRTTFSRSFPISCPEASARARRPALPLVSACRSRAAASALAFYPSE